MRINCKVFLLFAAAFLLVGFQGAAFGNQVRIASILQMEMDTNCHDLGRVVFSTSGSSYDLVYLDDEIF
ncbi:MAG: hypothetical protein IIU43_11205, partial [Thermoguttaceae bacterium]|nr:hypothetical protein [Thermoguttaceae bacterium]